MKSNFSPTCFTSVSIFSECKCVSNNLLNFVQAGYLPDLTQIK